MSASETVTVTRRIPVLPLAAAAIVIVAAVWYFGFRGSPATAPLTERDTVLVSDFVNTTGDAVFDDALRQAVAVLLQQSPFLTLMSDQRIQRTLRLMQRPGEEAVVGDIAREACQRAGATATVEGSIAPLGSDFVITIGVHNCHTGALLAQQRVQASSREDVLNQLGVAVKGLRENLGESLASIGRYDVPVTDATTTSLEALRAYGQGVKTRSTRGDEASIPFFTQAIEKDPGFALAYAKLGVVTSNIGRLDEAKDHARKAYELGAKVSEYERLYINWNYASRVMQDEKAVKEALELLTAAYPRDFAARNNFGVYYNNNGQFEEGLEQYQAATGIAPDEPGPHSNAAYAAFYLGRFEEGSASVDRALSLRPDGNLAIARWMAARLANHPRTGEFEQVVRQLANVDQIAFAEAAIAAWEGRFKDFTRIQSETVTRARSAGNEDLAQSVGTNERLTRAVYLQGKDLEALKVDTRKETEPAVLAQFVSAMAMLGDIEPGRAALPRLAKSDVATSGSVAVTRAYVLAHDGKYEDAMAELQRTLAQFPRAQDLHFMMGDIRQQAGQIDEAIAEYRRIVDGSAYFGANAVVPGARLKLAQLLLRRGDAAGAKAQLDALLTQWKNADTEFPSLTETKKLRAQIKD